MAQTGPLLLKHSRVRLLVGHRPLSPEFGDAIVETALRAIAPLGQ